MWMLVLVLPWFVAIFWRAGDAFFAEFDRRRHAEQAVGAGIPRRAARRFILLLFWVTFWPGAPLAGMAAPAVWRARREPGAQFLLAWLIPSWIVFEAGADQAAALCAAALSGDRDPDRRRAGAPRAVAIMADARGGLVVCDSRA